MASAIDPSKPIVGSPTTASVRDNFAAAKAEIEALQAQVAAILTSFSTQAVITADFIGGVNLGAPPPNQWHRRPLNTIIENGGFLIGLADNAFTLPAGLYALRAEFPMRPAWRFQLRLRDTVFNTTLDQTINKYQPVTGDNGETTVLESFINLPAQRTLAYEMRQEASDPDFGWGASMSWVTVQRYGRVTIRKLPQ